VNGSSFESYPEVAMKICSQHEKVEVDLCSNNLVISLVDVRFPTHFLTLRIEHLKCGNRGYDTIDPTNLVSIESDTIFKDGL